MYRESKFCICLRHCFGNLMATERISLTGRGGGGPRGSGVLLGVVGAGVSSAGRRRSISELSDDRTEDMRALPPEDPDVGLQLPL